MIWCDFEELTPFQLYDLLRLRCAVFVVEQNCAFAEIDGIDPDARHLLAYGPDGRLQGCLRVLRDDKAEKDWRIGRVVVAPTARGTGLGGAMMAAALAMIAERHGSVPVILSAQAHLAQFYGRFGFSPTGSPYLEDGIPHIDMRRSPPQKGGRAS